MQHSDHANFLDKRHLHEIGQNVKAVRRSKGFTQEQMAERADMDVRKVKRIESGTSITLDNMLAICYGLDCTLSELFPREYRKYVSPFVRDLCSAVIS